MRLLAILLLSASVASAAEITVTTLPEQPLIEVRDHERLLNFDFVITNPTDRNLVLNTVELNVRRSDGTLIHQRRIGTNGDSIHIAHDRELEPKGTLVVFNPFHSLSSDHVAQHLEYEFIFGEGESEDVMHATTVVRPKSYAGKTDLILPVTGRNLVHDGHDYLSHHRRLDITGGFTTAMNIRSNFLRYAYDFSVVNEAGKMFSGKGEKNEEWYGFGTPIVAPGGGKVVVARNDIPDNTKEKKVQFSRDEIMKEPFLLMGNHVVIDHGNGEFSLFAHMKHGTVTVRAGDVVKQGQQIGGMGMSGDAFTVHLHYQLQSDPKFGEGLPSYFRNFKRLTGDGWKPVTRGQVDTGDVIISTLVKKQ